mmetsp:Transcript_18764/g.34595  ORF Transcript_18764/g.34595 Transcript_18764/m.34595 type:complete len:156 (+) Transcript_18764:65-532(+)
MVVASFFFTMKIPAPPLSSAPHRQFWCRWRRHAADDHKTNSQDGLSRLRMVRQQFASFQQHQQQYLAPIQTHIIQSRISQQRSNQPTSIIGTEIFQILLFHQLIKSIQKGCAAPKKEMAFPQKSATNLQIHRLLRCFVLQYYCALLLLPFSLGHL